MENRLRNDGEKRDKRGRNEGETMEKRLRKTGWGTEG